MTIDEVYKALLGNLGAVVLLLLILYGGYKKWWVWGWYAGELKDRNSEISALLKESLGTARVSTHMAESATSRVEKSVSNDS